MKKILTLFAFALVAFTANAQSTLMGDVNGDGAVTITDVSMMVAYILGQQSDDFIEANADANGDGIITVTDVAETVNIILEGNSNTPQAYLTCPDNHHPHFIDLGLPSGTKWACCNVEATKPEMYGGYYAWGEASKKDVYNDVTYKYAIGEDNDGDGWYDDYHSDTGYSGVWQSLGADIAGSEYDVAHVKWGSSWVMPSLSQIEELVEYCTYEYTSLNDVEGEQFTGLNGGTIFLPSAGYRKGDGLSHPEEYGDYWSSTPIPSSTGNAYCLYFNKDEAGCNHFNRANGRSVRPVSVENTFSPLAVSTGSVVINIGDTETIKITSGNGSYTASSSDTNVATAELSNNSVIVTAKSKGQANITVTDELTFQTAIIKVKVRNPDEIPQAYLTCPDDNHPHAIDLGLPSGKKWACCNVGADKPEAYGGYYAWGETYEKDWYNDDTYPYFVRTDEWSYYYISLGNDISGTEHDVAHVKWGGSWVMPSQEDLEELHNNTTFTHDKQNGVYGGRLTSSNGGHIFMPAAGCRGDNHYFEVGEYGNYWTSTQFPPVYLTLYVFQCLCCAYHYNFGTERNGYYDKMDYYDGHGPGNSLGGPRTYGLSVRPIWVP